MIGHVNKWGNSLGIRVPKPIAEQLGIEKGSTVEFFVKSNHELVILVPTKTATKDDLTANTKTLDTVTA
ncbi:MAG: AbrB/MazE/SpoVT family DNA-binding domain-containing protein [Gammaproteobacteria bacterium]|nr:AbrB/MazE/SpoVT family DNA-binding domain-containing protein [Gammaproteobacteria bacterium]